MEENLPKGKEIQIPPWFRQAQGKTPFFLKFAWQTQPGVGFASPAVRNDIDLYS